MPTELQFQYQITTRPVFFGSETVTESRWHQPWSEPVRRKIDPQLAVALAASGAVFPLPLFRIDWYAPLSEPVRFKPELPARLHQFLAAPSRLLPTPNVIGTMRAQETGDELHASGTPFNRPVSIKIAMVEDTGAP